jgi:imidazole glycerol-phosphate synthase subunit HisH
MKVAIVNYGLGNINSIKNAVYFGQKNIALNLVDDPDQLIHYDKVILPGVGAFEDAMRLIRDKNFDEALIEVRNSGKFILGICLGMQLLATRSYEFGEHEGLNFIEGEVRKFDSETDFRIPHTGWNNVKFKAGEKLFNNIESNSDFYFVHSYYFNCKNESYSIGITDYINDFSSAIKKDNVFGTQFHPEKSQRDGLQLINNFLKL